MACQVTEIMLPNEVASQDTSCDYRLHCLIEPAPGSPLEDLICPGTQTLPALLSCWKQLWLSAHGAWERLPQRGTVCVLSVCACVAMKAGAHASPLYSSYLLHLSYYFHLELKKLQSRLNWLSGAFSKGGSQ